MNYETAKKLKDAGFPQDWGKVSAFYDKDGTLYTVGDVSFGSRWEGNPDGSGYHTASDGGCGCCSSGVGSTVNEYTYAPTTEELIEACGEMFYSLTLRQDPKEWEALGDKYWRGLGATPEEAVAELWLALNGKK